MSKKMRTGHEFRDPPARDGILTSIAKQRTGRDDLNPAAVSTALARTLRGASGKTAKKRLKEAAKLERKGDL